MKPRNRDDKEDGEARLSEAGDAMLALGRLWLVTGFLCMGRGLGFRV